MTAHDIGSTVEADDTPKIPNVETLDRRDFLRRAAAVGVGSLFPLTLQRQSSFMPTTMPTTPTALVDIATATRLADEWRTHFPALDAGAPTATGARRPFLYLDNAATVHRPRAVIEAMTDFYYNHNGNPGAKLHALADDANERYEAARARVGRFLGASDPLEVVFTRGTSEAINLVASTWCASNLHAGDEIIVTETEHYSNLVPWQLATRRAGATLRFLEVSDGADLDLGELDRMLTPRTRLVAVSHVSNVLGVINPVREIARRAHTHGALVLIDGAQSTPHVSVNVADMGCDFFALSAHKLMGPMGSGALWARRELLEAMLPYQAGGDMAHDVTRTEAQYAPGALKFEAGTPNVADAIGFAAALDFLEHTIRWDRLRAHETFIAGQMLERLGGIKGIRVLGAADASRPKRSGDRIGLVTFTVKSRAPLEVVHALDAAGIGIRGGELAALPLLQRFGVRAAARASAYLYTTPAEVDQFADALEHVVHDG